MTHDPALEQIYRGILSRAPQRSQEPPKSAKVERKGRRLVVCLKHERKDWNCQDCRTQYDRERRTAKRVKLAEGNRGK